MADFDVDSANELLHLQLQKGRRAMASDAAFELIRVSAGRGFFRTIRPRNAKSRRGGRAALPRCHGVFIIDPQDEQVTAPNRRNVPAGTHEVSR